MSHATVCFLRWSLASLLVFLSSTSHGFNYPGSIAYPNSIVSPNHPTACTIRPKLSPTVSMPRIDEPGLTRGRFISQTILGTMVLLAPGIACAFDGGVGGLGKTRPQTGVVFRDPETAAETTQTSSGEVTYELVAPDGTPVFLSFAAPWPLLKSAAGIEARDISGGESSYVQLVALPKGVTTLDNIKPALLSDSIFGSTGKFGMYGVPTDIKIKKISQTTSTAIFKAAFTTLTPAMRESDRRAFISAAIVGDGLFLLVTTSTSVRFGKLEGVLARVADSFTAIPAPKSSLNQRKS